MPKVSIIIPVYNTEKYLRRCLESAINQTYKNIEIIIINDASPDNSEQIISEFAYQYKNIYTITKSYNEGLSEARNEGLKHAQGEYIFFLDSDDYLEIDAIEKLVYLSLNYDCQLVNCNFVNVIGTIKLKKQSKNPTISIYDIEKNKELISKLGCLWNKLYHHDLIDNLTFPKGLWYEDTAFIYPLLTKVKNCISTNEIFYYYRRNINSITISSKINPTPKVLDIFKILEITKTNTINLGTFDDFSLELNNHMKALSLMPLLNFSTWFKIPYKERELLINNVYNYIRQKYNFGNILEIPYVNERTMYDKIYNLRIKLLLRYLKDYNLESDTINLDEAKRIITKYQKR